MDRLPLVLLPGLDGTGDLFERFTSLAPRVRGRLPAGRFAVLGGSFSGPLALAVSRAEPHRVSAVILCNSFVESPLTRLLRFAPWSLLFLLPPPRWVVRWFFVGRGASRELVDSVRAAVGKTPRNVLAQRMRSLFTLPRRASSSPLDVPVLVLTSADDRMVRGGDFRGLASTVVTKRIAGPHLLLQASPEAAWAAIAELLVA